MRRNFSRVLTLGDSLATITLTHPSILQVESSPAQKLAVQKIEKQVFLEKQVAPGTPSKS